MFLGKKEQSDAIREFLSVSKKSFLFAGFFSLFINILMLLPTFYMLAVYDIVVPTRSSETLLFITALVVFLYFILVSLQIIRGKILVRINNNIDAVLNKKVIDAMYKLSLKHPTKATIQPFNDFNQIKQFLTSSTVFAFFDAPWLPIYLAILFIFHPYYGYFGVATAVIIVSMTFLNEITTKKLLNESNDAFIKSRNYLNNNIRNVEVIEAMGMKERLYNRWMNLYQNYQYLLQKASDKGVFWSNSTQTVRLMSQSLILGLGGYLASNLEISMGMIIAGSIVLGRALQPLDLIVNTWKNFSSARQSYIRLNALLKDYAEEKQLLKLPEPQGNITLQNVYAVPPDSKIASLKGITMHINAGEVVAIIGPSGAGKSSLARVMLGVWPIVNGKIEIDGADINQWDKEYLGKYIGYLPQDIELFEGTVAENIARFDDIDDQKVLQAAQISGAHDIIIKFPEGYNTYIGPGGITLSGGQRQRVALARALYGNPKIVVLDEPNSHLDDAGELALLNAIIKLKQNKTTVIIISHKVNILQIVDKIAVLMDGQLIAYGPRDEILQRLARREG